jgi:hypothetical protein
MPGARRRCAAASWWTPSGRYVRLLTGVYRGALPVDGARQSATSAPRRALSPFRAVGAVTPSRSLIRRERRAALQAAAARWVASLHRAAEQPGGVLRTRGATLCVLLLALVGACLIEPGRFEAAGRSAAAQHDHQAEQGPSHQRRPLAPRSIRWTSRRGQEKCLSVDAPASTAYVSGRSRREVPMASRRSRVGRGLSAGNHDRAV